MTDYDDTNARIRQAIDRAAMMAAVKVQWLIKEHAKMEDYNSRVKGYAKSGYYENERAPVWTGEMLFSMTEVFKNGDGWTIRFNAPHTKAIEYGDIRTWGDVKFDPKAQQWAQDRHVFMQDSTIIGFAHPFIRPRFYEVIKEFRSILVNELTREFGVG